MKARVDQDVCIGSAICVSIVPDAFELNNQGLSQAVDSSTAADDLLREAAETCPSQAIILEDDEGNQVYP